MKRSNIISTYLHKVSKNVVDFLIKNEINTVIVGKNKGWKNDKTHMKHFIQIPFADLISKIEYKCKLEGINFLTTEEFYTSKCSFIDKEEIFKKSPKDDYKFKGQRVHRGLFKSSNGTILNADYNGALNMIRKEFPNAFNNKNINKIVKNPLHIINI